MQVNLPYAVMLDNNFLQGETLNASIVQKTESGYIINLNGMQVPVLSDLDFLPGEELKLKVVESLPSRLVLRVVKTEVHEKSIRNHFPSPLEMLSLPETRAAIKLLAKLNLPITEHRVSAVSDLLTIVVSKNEHPDSGSDEAVNLKEYLAIKALNQIHKETGPGNICFFALPLPEHKTVYFKITDTSKPYGGPPKKILSFIVETDVLGPILAEISLIGDSISSSLTFEEKRGIELARKALAKLGPDSSTLLLSLKLKTGKVSRKNFFFAEMENWEFPKSINLKA